MKHKKRLLSLVACSMLFILTPIVKAQNSVDINLNVKHVVGGVFEFDRTKFITIHANQTENEWDGDNFTTDLRDEFLNGFDVYLGRDTGGITWNLNNMAEDPTRPGFANPSEITRKGNNARNNFASKTKLHTYESRKVNSIVAAQLHPFWTGESQRATNGTGWKMASPTATGEYMGRYFNEFHGGNGQIGPTWVEIINEPAYDALGGKRNFTNSLQEIADFHVEAADAMRAQNPNLKIGGYCAAFPDFETGNFQRWNNREKIFIDVAGSKMDFWSIHLYDFPVFGGKKDLRSGSNVEATFDMMDHYSMLKLNQTKPYVISEYGAQTHDLNNQGWTAIRDWMFLKSQNSLMMSFMERPDNIAVAIPFTIVKAEWGFNNAKNIPYSSRLMRKTNEPASYTGTWIYSDRVKFYELWKNVKGVRIDTKASDLDIQVDAYIDGNKGYVILNNLEFVAKSIDLNIFDKYKAGITSITKKHLTLVGSAAVMQDETFTTPISNVQLGAESTMILEYTFDKNISIDEESQEVKYYADSYLKPIIGSQTNVFNVNGITKSATYGEAVLRLGIGRTHGKTLKPIVKVNNTVITVPDDWRGYDQAQKGQFFGTLEIPVSYDVLNTNNTVSVEFSDTGGYVSSVIMQVFNFSSDVRTLSVKEVKDNESSKKLNVYPNPTNGVFNISNIAENEDMQIYNISGLKIMDLKASKDINISELASGVYFLKTKNNEVTKIIKH
tara:strand:+ start:2014 stop:4188 length:2175 start_codon:yes stop_codon:yes gene_type:complete